MSFMIKEITLNHRAVEHQDTIIESFCFLVIIGCFLCVALGSALRIEVNVSFCMMAQCQLEPEVRRWVEWSGPADLM